MIVALIITAVVLSILAGFSKAICDLSEEGKLKFKNYFFWWKDYAWKNKWKLKDNGVPVLKNGQYIPKFWQSDNFCHVHRCMAFIWVCRESDFWYIIYNSWLLSWCSIIVLPIWCIN